MKKTLYILSIIAILFSACAKDQLDPLHFIKIYNSDSHKSYQMVDAVQLNSGKYVVYSKDDNEFPHFMLINEDGSFNKEIRMPVTQSVLYVTSGFSLNSKGEIIFQLSTKKGEYDFFKLDDTPTPIVKVGMFVDQGSYDNHFPILTLNFQATTDGCYLLLYQNNSTRITVSKVAANFTDSVFTKRYDFNPLSTDIFPNDPPIGALRDLHYVRERPYPDDKNSKYYFKSFYKNNFYTVSLSDKGTTLSSKMDSIGRKEDLFISDNLINLEIICDQSGAYYNYKFVDYNSNKDTTYFSQYDQNGAKSQIIDTIRIKNKELLVVAGSSNHGRALLMFFDLQTQKKFIATLYFGSGNDLESNALVVTKDNGIALFGTTLTAGFMTNPFMIKLTEADILKELAKSGYNP